MNEHELFTQIVREHLGLETLETRNSDRLDFHDLAVWQIEKALRAAYEAGRASTQRGRTQANKEKQKPCQRP